MKWYWIQSGPITCGVCLHGTLIVDTAPILSRFKGQHMKNLEWWLIKKFKNYVMEEL